MSDDHNGRTSHRRRRSEAHSVSGKCVACASSIVAGIAGMGLSWLAGSGLPGNAAATRSGEIELITVSDPLSPFMNQVIILPGADDTVVLPSDNVINLPFGGDGLNNFFGPGTAGAAGGAAEIATGQTWTDYTTPVDQITIPFLNDTIVLPGSNDTFVYLASLFSGNAINFPFFGGGQSDFFGFVFPQAGIALANASNSVAAAGNPDTLPTMPTDALPTNAIVLPGSADTIVFPSFNTIDFPFGGVGENNFFGGGNGGNGGVGTGIGIGGNSAATAGGTTANATSNADNPLTASADPTTATGNDTVFPGAGQTIVFPSNNTINFPFGGDGENNFFGGGNGGNGGNGTGIGIGGSGSDATGTGIGIGGAGGNGGEGTQFFPIQVNFVDSSNANPVTITDSTATSSNPASESLGSFLSGILGSNGSSNLSEATGTAIGIGGPGGDGGNGAVLFPFDINVNTADLSSSSSSSLFAFLDSLLGNGGSSDLASLAGSSLTNVAGGTSVSIDGIGGAGGSAAEFLPISLDWVDSSGAHSVTVTPLVLFDDFISFLASGATDPTSFAGGLGNIFGDNLSALMADLGSLF